MIPTALEEVQVIPVGLEVHRCPSPSQPLQQLHLQLLVVEQLHLS